MDARAHVPLMRSLRKLGLGGGCHWCTEAVFQSLVGVERVRQGFITSDRLRAIAEPLRKSGYGEYLLGLLVGKGAFE